MNTAVSMAGSLLLAAAVAHAEQGALDAAVAADVRRLAESGVAVGDKVRVEIDVGRLDSRLKLEAVRTHRAASAARHAAVGQHADRPALRRRRREVECLTCRSP